MATGDKIINLDDLKVVHDKLNGDLTDLKGAVTGMTTATAGDVGKALKAKTVSGGKVIEWEFGDMMVLDDTLTQEGEAADAKAAGDAIASVETAVETEQTRAAAAEALKVNKPTSSPNGTSGQLLRTNGDGTTQWVDQGLPTDEQTAEAVTAWLDDHPEATTTVQDGAITMPKLNSELQDTVVVKTDTEIGYYHNVPPTKVTVYPNEYTQDVEIRYAGSENILNHDYYRTGTIADVAITRDKRFLRLNGTAASAFEILRITDSTELAKLSGKTVNICIYVKKSTSWEVSSSLSFQYYVNGAYYSGTSFSFASSSSAMFGWTYKANVTIPENLSRFVIKFMDGGIKFSAGDFIWIGLYENTPVNTEEIITDTPLDITNSELSCIDTLMHESTAEQIVPTKTYIDSHIPDIIGFWTENVYVMPEHFGAIGDGVADDATAIANCLAYAAANGKAVKGYGSYKISNAIIVGWQYADVYLREIIYTGNNAAVELQHTNIKFTFHRISSSSVGIYFSHNNDAAPKYARQCNVSGNEISSTGDCVVLHTKTLYNTCEIRYLNSTNGNCITGLAITGEFNAAEFVFMNSSCACPNGYVAYNVKVAKFYNFTVEKNCKFGLYNPVGCECYSWRHREQCDGMMMRLIDGDTSYNNGALITFTEQPSSDGRYGFKYKSNDPIPYISIDVSALDGYSPIPSDAEATSMWMRLAYNGFMLGTPVKGVTGASGAIISDDLYFIGGHKVFMSKFRKEITISSATYDYRLYESQSATDIIATGGVAFGTDFIINVAHTDIYFNASFGAVGYNDLTVTQKDGNTCTIYDKLGNVLFDGTNEGDGVWSLKCKMDTSSFGRLGYVSLRWVYDGTNEIWEITKLS